jgi:cytochrome c peroxidase
MSNSTLCSKASLAALLALVLTACNPDGLSEEEREAAMSLSLSALEPLPADPSNRFADNLAAAALGERLFFDASFSRDGDVACATCHLPDKQMQDGLPLGKGAGTTDRRTMPLIGVAWSPWFFWDGRKDSMWSQALGPLESQVEHAGTRTFYAHQIAANYRDEYESIFGALPDLASLPPSAGPFGNDAESDAWAALDPAMRGAVDTVFANIGKALAAFQRRIEVPPTRFDAFAAALAQDRRPEENERLSPDEIAGFRLFIGKGQCINCHNGPRLTDDHFHNTGVPQAPSLPQDRGRAAAIEAVEKDPFNCLGEFSDARPDQCGELKFMSRDTREMERAFKPPSLRGVAGRPPYMHSGQIATLEAVIEHYSQAPAAPSGHSELKPLGLTDKEKAELIAFLKTLGD